MDGWFKAVLTAGTVVLVMVAARQGGRRLAGMVAALPTITAPTLAWLAQEEGVAFAVRAAVGSVAACAMLAMFALGYARAARCGRSAVVALACGLAGAGTMALPAEAASGRLTDAITLALGCCALAFVAMPAPGADGGSPGRSSRSMLLVAAAAGGLTALATTVGPGMGGFATGLLSSLPLVTGAVVVVEHGSCGHPAVTRFLRAYVGGLFGKAAFGVVFALLAPRIGTVTALVLACACAGLMSTVRPSPAPVGVAPPRARPSRDRPE